MARKSGAWLRKKYDTFNGSSFGRVDDDCDEQNSSTLSSQSASHRSPPKIKVEFNRALTLHKPTQIGSLLKSRIDSNSEFGNDSSERKLR